MRKLICAMAAALALGTNGAAANYDYVDDKGYRHWDHTGTDATEKPAASATPKGSKRRPVIHAASKPLVKPRTLRKAATKPLVSHGTLSGHAKTDEESPKVKGDRYALFQEFQEFLLSKKPRAIEPPKREPTPEPQPAGNNGQQKANTETADTATHATSAPEPGSSATLPNRKDAPTATSLAARQDFAPSFLKSNKSEPTPEAQPTGDYGRPSSKTETADAATHAISAPERGSSTALPNGKDTSAATTLVSREDFAPSLLKSNQQNSVSNVVVPDKVPELFFRQGAKIIELLQATDYSDYAPHEIPPEVIALEPVLGMFLFVKRPDGGIGLVSDVTHRTLGILKYRDASAPRE